VQLASPTYQFGDVSIPAISASASRDAMARLHLSLSTSNSVEIDLVALDEPNKRIRFGSCKRAASAHDRAALTKFEKHVAAFLLPREHRQLQGWSHEKVLFASEFGDTERAALSEQGYLCKDLYDYAKLV
jgi:uncharacterized protein